MKTKKTVMTLAVCLVAVGVSFASPNMGTWKLNEAKSKFPPGASKSVFGFFRIGTSPAAPLRPL